MGRSQRWGVAWVVGHGVGVVRGGRPLLAATATACPAPLPHPTLPPPHPPSYLRETRRERPAPRTGPGTPGPGRRDSRRPVQAHVAARGPRTAPHPTRPGGTAGSGFCPPDRPAATARSRAARGRVRCLGAACAPTACWTLRNWPAGSRPRFGLQPDPHRAGRRARNAGGTPAETDRARGAAPRGTPHPGRAARPGVGRRPPA